MNLILRNLVWASCGPVAFLAASSACSAQAPAEPKDASYGIVEPSQYEYGCFNGCACPVIGLPMHGDFRLVFQYVDPLYTNYLVEGFEAEVPLSDGLLHLTGDGTYRIGGEVAVTQEMTLDLVADGEVYRFESGPVQGGGAFSTIDIDLAARGFACHDTVLALHAVPETSGADDPPPVAVLLASPNPFRTAVELRFVQATEGPLEASVFDARGRLVRRIAENTWSARGPHAIAWDGRRDGGGQAPSGLYFVRIRVPGREWRRMVVKLE